MGAAGGAGAGDSVRSGRLPCAGNKKGPVGGPVKKRAPEGALRCLAVFSVLPAGEVKATDKNARAEKNRGDHGGCEGHRIPLIFRTKAVAKKNAAPMTPPVIWAGWNSPTIRQPTLAFSSQR